MISFCFFLFRFTAFPKKTFSEVSEEVARRRYAKGYKSLLAAEGQNPAELRGARGFGCTAAQSDHFDK